MTRFEMNLNGLYGPYWVEDAKREIAKMEERVDNDEIRTSIGGGAFWNSNGRYLPEEQAVILSYTDFPFSLEETNRARETQTAAFLENYRSNYTGPSTEERAEMQAVFGPGATVIDIITGQRV